MSHPGKKKSHGKSRKDSSLFPTEWSAWEWSVEYGQDYRYRVISDTGDQAVDYQYQYREDRAPARDTSALRPIPEAPVQQAYTTSTQVADLTRQFNQTSLGPPTTGERHIQTRYPNRNDEPLDRNFKVHRTKDFDFGAVFKILWTEPLGTTGTEITGPSIRSGKYGEKSFSTIRRFVVVRSQSGHSLCLPILTYGGKGLLKPGVKPEDHCIIYTDSAKPHQSEQILNKSIQMKPRTPRDKLDTASRLNFAKVYTVEHNVKVLFIGKISSGHVDRLVNTFNRINMVSEPPTYNDGQPSMNTLPSGSNTSLPVSYSSVPATIPRSYGPISSVPYMSDGSYNPLQHYASQSEPDTHGQPPQYDGSLYEE